MFGGLELKSKPSTSTVNDNDDNNKVGGTTTSSFSFLQSSTASTVVPAAAAATTTGTAADTGNSSSSGFSFLMNTTTVTPVVPQESTKKKAEEEIEVESANRDKPSNSNSGFSFLSSTLPTSTSHALPEPTTNTTSTIPYPSSETSTIQKDSSSTSSGFGFLQSMTSTTSTTTISTNMEVVEDVKNRSATNADDNNNASSKPDSMYSFLSNPASSSTVAINKTNAMTESPMKSKRKEEEEEVAPKGSGLTFQIAPPKKKIIKKRSRTKKVGINATTAATTTTPVMSPPSITPEESTTRVLKLSSSNEAAMEVSQKAEEFIRQKQLEQSKLSHVGRYNDTATTTDKTPPTSPINDETYNAAKQAALNHIQQQSSSSQTNSKNNNNNKKGSNTTTGNNNTSSSNTKSNNFLSNLFTTPRMFGQNNKNNNNNNTKNDNNTITSKTNDTNFTEIDDTKTHNHDDSEVTAIHNNDYEEVTETKQNINDINTNSVVPAMNESKSILESRADQLQREQEEYLKRLQIMEQEKQREEHRIMIAAEDQKKKQQLMEQERMKQQQQEKEQEERRRQEEAEKEKKSSPFYQFDSIVNGLQQTSMDRLMDIHKVRSDQAKRQTQMVEVVKKLLMVKQQITKAEKQQIEAADVTEDYELAEQLAHVIQSLQDELTQLENEKTNIIFQMKNTTTTNKQSTHPSSSQSLTEAFTQVYKQLEELQSNPEYHKVNSSLILKNFANTSQRISSENERLIADLNNIERDKKFTIEERNELESNISEQTTDIEIMKDECSNKLKVVRDEIEELRRVLKQKETEETELVVTIESHTSAIDQIRTKFTRQLNRVEKKEKAIEESHMEWKAEKAAYDAMKDNHDKEVRDHSEALLKHDELMEQVQKEIDAAKKMEKILGEEIDVIADNINDNNDDEEFTTIATTMSHGASQQWELDVLNCEAALVEANQVLNVAQAAIGSLEEEIDVIDRNIPILEESKKAAAAKRDFKAAGKFSREMKEAVARKERCIEELEGEAKERMESAMLDLEKISRELERKNAIAVEKEKESALKKMETLAEKISRLQFTKKELNSMEVGPVLEAGVSILDTEINSLQNEAEALGSTFGGWENIADKYSIERNKESPNSTSKSIDEEKEENDNETTCEPKSDQQEQISDSRGSDEIDYAMVKRYSFLKNRVNDLEQQLEEAIAVEDYDTAANLDEQFQELVAELGSMKLTDAELELTAECADIENDDILEDVDKSDDNHEGSIDETEGKVAIKSPADSIDDTDGTVNTDDNSTTEDVVDQNKHSKEEKIQEEVTAEIVESAEEVKPYDGPASAEDEKHLERLDGEVTESKDGTVPSS